MDDLVDRLYTEFGGREDPRPEQEKEALAEYRSMCDQIQGVFGLGFVDRLMELKAKLDHADDLSDFRRGIRLGARLALELFRPA